MVRLFGITVAKSRQALESLAADDLGLGQNDATEWKCLYAGKARGSKSQYYYTAVVPKHTRS